jgi:hypothetical protein
MESHWEYKSKNGKFKNVDEWFNAYRNETIYLINRYNDYFMDIDKHTQKYLKCNISSPEFGEKSIMINENHPVIMRYPFENVNYDNVKLHIVYFATLYFGNHCITLIKHQLNILLETKLLQTLPHSKLYIIITIPNDNEIIEKEIKNLFAKEWIENKKIIITFHNENTFEYEGIHKVYTLGNECNENEYIAYFHSKGMSRFNQDKNYDEFLRYFSPVFQDWKWVLFVLHNFHSMDKIGLNSSTEGWMWYNFWWVKSTYLKKIERPIKTNRRHYYEDWIARHLFYPISKDKNTNEEILIEFGNQDINNFYYVLTNSNCFNLVANELEYTFHIGSIFVY